MSSRKQYVDFYNDYRSLIHGHSHPLLNAQRDEAAASFAQRGFTAADGDYYRQVDLNALYATDYGINVNRLQGKFNPYRDFHCDVPAFTPWLYYVVNDIFYAAEQSAPLPEGVVVCSMREAAERYPEVVERYYGRSIGEAYDGNDVLNKMYAQDGFFVYVPQNTVMEKPIQLVNVLNSPKAALSLAHNLVVVEQGAKAIMVVCDHATEAVPLLANRITEVFVGEAAEYDHYKVESTNASTVSCSRLNVSQAAASNVVTNIVTLHNGVTRNNINIDLLGEHASTTLCGMFIGGATQQTDNATTIRHLVPNCKSTELFKYILDDEAKGNFLGRILVAEGATGTEAYQTNRNICVTPQARMYTKPQLEIYNDDVKCSHGATVGQLDEGAMFYMCSRGIPEREARMLLMSAFASDVLDNIRVENLRDRIRLLVDKRLRGEASHCDGCAICSK